MTGGTLEILTTFWGNAQEPKEAFRSSLLGLSAAAKTAKSLAPRATRNPNALACGRLVVAPSSRQVHDTVAAPLWSARSRSNRLVQKVLRNTASYGPRKGSRCAGRWSSHSVQVRCGGVRQDFKYVDEGTRTFSLNRELESKDRCEIEKRLGWGGGRGCGVVRRVRCRVPKRRSCRGPRDTYLRIGTLLWHCVPRVDTNGSYQPRSAKTHFW